jgi:class 3 adenylate cyclase/tetratricopeptide (TPR) repeat protein
MTMDDRVSADGEGLVKVDFGGGLRAGDLQTVGAGPDSDELLSVLFTDLVGSTEMTDRIGDEATGELLRTHNELLGRQVERFGGRVVKSTGDGFLITFASVRRSIACAVAIQQVMSERNRRQPNRPLRVRIGINAGEISVGRDDVQGSAVNAAARIVDKAGAGEILISETVKQLGGSTPGITYVERGRVRLRGFEDRWRIFQVTWTEEAAATAPAPPSRTVFVGREKEQAILQQKLELAIGGQGGLVMIGGEAGIGKTRLSEQLAERGLRQGMRVLVGHCYETEGTPPYIPFLEILEASLSDATSPEAFRNALGDDAAEVARIMPELRRIFPDIPVPLQLPPEQERHYLLNSVRAFVNRASTNSPLLLVLEDLHWADEPTLLLTQHLAERLAESPVLIVGTHRDSDVDIGDSLTRVLEALHRRRLVHRISLKGLGRDGVAEMLGALSGHVPPADLVQAVFDETEGNAFFVEEVFRYLAESGRLFDEGGRFQDNIALGDLDVPEGVRLVVGRRLEKLSEEHRATLASAAVIGRRFSFKLLQELSEIDADDLLDAIDEAESAGLILSSAETNQARFSFAHELIRQTLVSGLSSARRQVIHLRIAEALERLHADHIDTQVAEIAHHMSSAGDAADPLKTAEFLVRAGDRALAAAAFEDALRVYRAAVALLPPDTTAGADARRQLGIALRCLGLWDEALAAWDEALATYERLGDALAVGQLCRIAAVQLSWRTRFAEAIQMAGRGLAALGDRSNPDRARLMCFTGSTMAMAGNAAQGEAMVVAATRMADELGDAGALAYVAYAGTAQHFASLQYRESVALGVIAEPRQHAVGNVWDLASLQGWVAQSEFAMGHFAECEAICGELAGLADRIGHIGVAIYPPRLRASIEFMRTGDIDGWRGFAVADLENSTTHGLPLLADDNTYLGLAEFWAGNWDKALELLAAGLPDERPGALGGNAAILAVCQAYAGATEEALATVAAHETSRPAPGQTNGRGAWTSLLCDVETLAVAGEASRAAELYPLLAAALETSAAFRPYDFRLLETLAGIAAAAGKDWDRAEAHFAVAMRLAETLPSRLEQADARRFYAQTLDARGDPDRAAALRAEALVIYRAMGMPRHAELVAGP